MYLANRLAGVFVGGDQRDLDVRVAEQYAEQFAAAVTRTAEDRGFYPLSFVGRHAANFICVTGAYTRSNSLEPLRRALPAV